MSALKTGSDYEKKVEKYYQSLGYITHRMLKSRFGKQDFLTIGDVMATKADDFVIVACTVGQVRYSTTLKKIKEMRKHIPVSIRIENRILFGDKEEVRQF